MEFTMLFGLIALSLLAVLLGGAGLVKCWSWMVGRTESRARPTESRPNSPSRTIPGGKSD